ncbi:serine aminopeptidase domain-containing protein [Phenylobacterium sp.]|uniref:serine aminopeptidase domain-containing protein n=1 Tax=Phenylobacterium sp. TaxID=1871053 RepID=UPI002BB97372|nr:alpha/beta hydrolase [Phenylobacterium sp.]HLZ73699.1 alpha/beta hydrolase [Phenylobacterium sp.]
MRWTAVAVVGLALSVAVLAGAARAQEACANGAWRAPDGRVAALATAPPGAPAGDPQRYNLIDGRAGKLGAADAPVVCEGGVLKDRGKDGVGGGAWTRIPLRATPTDFIGHGGVRLHGLLLEPVRSAGKPPAVVLVHGSEATSPILRFYQVMFAGQGVAAFAYDKRGTGQSQGVYTQDFDVLADDAAAAVEEVRRLAKGRIGRIGLEGGSQGGWIAPAAAAKARADFVEVAFGMVATPIEQDVWQVDYELKARGFSPDILPKVHAVTDATAAVARADFAGHLDGLQAVRERYGAEPWFSKISGQYSGEILSGKLVPGPALDRKELDDWLAAHVPWDYDSEAVLKRLKAPQLWVMAQDDSVAVSAPSIARLKKLRQAGADIDIRVFPHADHGIRLYTADAEGQHHATPNMADGYLKLLADWAKGVRAPPYGESFAAP